MNNATLVTGASGFLGRRVCDRLIAEGIPVIATGRDARRLPLLSPSQGVAMVADLSDEFALRHACAGADTVIHCAALSSPWGRAKDFIEANFEGTRRLLGAARLAGVRRFVHVSSSSVVFDGSDATRITERTPYASCWLSHYQRTKAAAEGLVHATHGLETVILRPRAIFGPGDTALLPRLLSAGRAGWLRIIGTGRNVQDLTHVDNVVDALMLARTAKAAVGHTYFISNGEPVALWELIFELFDALGVKRPTSQVSKGAAMAFGAVLEASHRVGLLEGEPRLTRYTAAILAAEQTLDITAARRDLGYAPRIPMSKAVAETIDSLRSPS